MGYSHPILKFWLRRSYSVTTIGKSSNATPLSRRLAIILCLWIPSIGFCQPLPCQTLPTPMALAQIGDWIYRNECNRQRDCLVDWNPGEAFPSLGIGHFIWYPAGVDAGFVESFPLLLAYLAQQHVPLPDWLAQSSLQDHAKLDAPWADRNEFLAHKLAHKAESLRELLEQHTAEQTAFMLQRLQQAIPTLVKHSATPLVLQRKLAALCQSPQGWYALMDYVNFKGEGLAPGETYQAQGWGLLQVLQNMEAEGEPTHAFAEAAARILSRRADLAPDAGERERWLPGWLKRVHTYPQQPMLD